MDEEDEDLCAIFGSEDMISSPQTFKRFVAPDPSRGAVMVEWPKTNGLGYKPHPEVRDSWDDRHVRMPFSKVATWGNLTCHIWRLQAIKVAWLTIHNLVIWS